MKKTSILLPLLAASLVMLAVIGCSESPLNSPADDSSARSDGTKAAADGQVQLAARVQIVDQNRQMLTLAGCPDTVVANQNCQIVRYNGFEEAPVPFSEIRCGDSVEVAGYQNQYQYIYANRLGICQDSGGVRYAARVETTNQDRRMLTFMGQPDSVIANQNCQITRLNGNTEAPIPFSEIAPGDSVQFYGERHQDRYVYARHLHVCTPGEGSYDVAVRDTITSIDYEAGSFMIAGRSETITVDAETIIWTNSVSFQDGPVDEGRGNSDLALSGGNFYRNDHDTLLSFADLAVGKVIELRADIVNETTLYARVIKLAPECLSQCLTFSDHLVSVDVDNRIVTFQNHPWIGAVCFGAKLTDLDGAPVALSEFEAGDYVTVKGYPLEGDTLKVTRIQLTPEP